MFSTGPMFLTLAFARFRGDRSSLWAMPQELYASPTAFFQHYQGSSWHGWDSSFILLVYTHWQGAAVALAVAVMLAVSIGRRKRSKTHRR